MRKSFTHEGQRHFVRCENGTDFEVKKALLIRDIEEGRIKIAKSMLVRDWWIEYYETDDRAKKYGLWVRFMLYCGLRPDETARVLGKHLDIKNKKLYIDGTKSKAAKRYVPLPDKLIPEFRALKPDPFAPLFTTRSGGKLTDSARRRHWQVIIRAMNIAMGCETHKGAIVPPYRVADDLVPYCLRHTYCTDIQAAGVPINIAKELMGHSSIEMTANIYTHTSKESFERARTLINGAGEKEQSGDTCGNKA